MLQMNYKLIGPAQTGRFINFFYKHLIYFNSIYSDLIDSIHFLKFITKIIIKKMAYCYYISIKM